MKNKNLFVRKNLIVFVVGLVLMVTQSSCFSNPDKNTAPTKSEHVNDKHEEENHGKGGKEHIEHENEEIIRLSDSDLKEFGIEMGVAGPGEIKASISLPGEVVINQNRLAHIVPRVPGVVLEVRKNVGDMVSKNEVLAVLDSRELANTKAAFLTALERKELARANYKREENLWKKKITSEQEYINARQALAETNIELRAAELKLHALGFTDKYIKELPKHPDAKFTRYEITAPFAGAVIEKHITMGETFNENETVFVIADLSNVWVNLSVYQKDLPHIETGQAVTISAKHGLKKVRGRISYVSPIVDEKTRTALARIVVANKAGKLQPGLFVTGRVTIRETNVPLLVPKTAIQIIDDKKVVFVKVKEGFEPRQVKTDRSDQMKVEITSGLEPGEKYAAVGAFTMKAQLSKGAFGGGHGH